MKDFGYRPVTVQFLGGLEVEADGPLLVPQPGPCRQRQRELFRPGAVGRVRPLQRRPWPAKWPSLPRALSSFEDAQARLRQMGVNMSIRRIANVAYHFAQRARSRQELDGMGIEGSLAGKRVVISTDGGRLRVRKNKRARRPRRGGRVIAPIGASPSCW